MLCKLGVDVESASHRPMVFEYFHRNKWMKLGKLSVQNVTGANSECRMLQEQMGVQNVTGAD